MVLLAAEAVQPETLLVPARAIICPVLKIKVLIHAKPNDSPSGA